MGQVGFAVGKHKDSNLYLHGGNQSDQINFTPWAGTVTYYFPKNFPLPNNSELLLTTAKKLNDEFGIVPNKKEGDISR